MTGTEEFRAFAGVSLGDPIPSMVIALVVAGPITLLSGPLPLRLQATAWFPGLGIRWGTMGRPLPATKPRIQAPTPQAIEAVVRHSLRMMLSAFALATGFAMGAPRRGQGVPLLVEWPTAIRRPRLLLPGLASGPSGEAYGSRMVPTDDDSSETGVPPPPRRLATRWSGWHHPGKRRPAYQEQRRSCGSVTDLQQMLKGA
jgi:hypothetical protein